MQPSNGHVFLQFGSCLLSLRLYCKKHWSGQVHASTRLVTTRKFSTSAGSYHTCSTPLGPLSTLKSYMAHITSGVSDVCPECGVAPHSVEHLFNCSAHPTQLTVQYLWDNPAEVADFLNLDSWRQWTRREELLGYHNNNNQQNFAISYCQLVSMSWWYDYVKAVLTMIFFTEFCTSCLWIYYPLHLNLWVIYAFCHL